MPDSTTDFPTDGYLIGTRLDATRLPAMKANEAVGLTPANWLKARSRKPERMAA